MRYLVAALAFVPVNRVEKCFEILKNSDVLPAVSEHVIDYFEDTWIGRPQNRSRRRATKFSLEWWNYYEKMRARAPKTNNAVEGWHRSFESTLEATHANIFKLLDALKKEQTLMETSYEQAIAGEPPSKRKKYKSAADRLCNLVNAYDDDEELCLTKNLVDEELLSKTHFSYLD